jgi:hypothetical protein
MRDPRTRKLYAWRRHGWNKQLTHHRTPPRVGSTRWKGVIWALAHPRRHPAGPSPRPADGTKLVSQTQRALWNNRGGATRCSLTKLEDDPMFQLRCHTTDGRLICLYFDTAEEAEEFACHDLPAWLDWDLIERY